VPTIGMLALTRVASTSVNIGLVWEHPFGGVGILGQGEVRQLCPRRFYRC